MIVVEEIYLTVLVESRELRKKRVQESLTLKPPTVEERLLLHNLFMNKGKTATEVDMSSTAYQSMIVMHPQKRNIHNKVFGGYLMRLAYGTLHLKTPHILMRAQSKHGLQRSYSVVCRQCSALSMRSISSPQSTLEPSVYSTQVCTVTCEYE